MAVEWMSELEGSKKTRRSLGSGGIGGDGYRAHFLDDTIQQQQQHRVAADSQEPQLFRRDIHTRDIRQPRARFIDAAKRRNEEEQQQAAVRERRPRGDAALRVGRIASASKAFENVLGENKAHQKTASFDSAPVHEGRRGTTLAAAAADRESFLKSLPLNEMSRPVDSDTAIQSPLSTRSVSFRTLDRHNNGLLRRRTSNSVDDEFPQINKNQNGKENENKNKNKNEISTVSNGPDNKDSVQVPKEDTLKALEMDYFMIRQTLKAIEERVALQEQQLSSGAISGGNQQNDKVDGYRVAEAEENHQKEWLEKMDNAPVDEQLEIRRVKMEEALQRVTQQLESMEQRLVQPPRQIIPMWTMVKHNVRRAVVHPISMILAAVLLLLLVCYIHVMYFDEDEKKLRRALGPDYYRTGWREYSVHAF